AYPSDRPVIERERFATRAALDRVCERALPVVRVEPLCPQVAVGQVLLRHDPEQALDLRADVGRGHLLVDRVDVDDRRDLLDQASVLGGGPPVPLDLHRPSASRAGHTRVRSTRPDPSTRFRPASLARYSAASAALTISSGALAPPTEVAVP